MISSGGGSSGRAIAADTARLWSWQSVSPDDPQASAPASGGGHGGVRSADAYLTALRFAPGKHSLLAAASTAGHVKVYDVERGVAAGASSRGHATVAADADNQKDDRHAAHYDSRTATSAPFLASAAQLNELRVPSASAGDIDGGGGAQATCLAWSPDTFSAACLGVAAAGDKRVRFYDLRERRSALVAAVEAPGAEYVSLEWSPCTARYVAVARRADKADMSFIDTRTWRLLKSFSYGDGALGEAKWTPAEDLFLMANKRCGIDVVRWPSLRSVVFHHVCNAGAGGGGGGGRSGGGGGGDAAATEGMDTSATACMPSSSPPFDIDRAQCRWMACGGDDALLRLYDFASLVCVAVSDRLYTGAREVKFSADGRLLAARGAGEEDAFIDISLVDHTDEAEDGDDEDEDEEDGGGGRAASSPSRAFGGRTLRQAARVEAPRGCRAMDWHSSLPLLAYSCIGDGGAVRMYGSAS